MWLPEDERASGHGLRDVRVHSDFMGYTVGREGCWNLIDVIYDIWYYEPKSDTKFLVPPPPQKCICIKQNVKRKYHIKSAKTGF